ncbi:hypothetical protein [Amycolatopsis sp. NPDC051716]|uniref:hypothetical protein n=1 Tax=Amycolatopsis sp. NPDC051716 TaxID=3155804 RepID=UPI00341B09C7
MTNSQIDPEIEAMSALTSALAPLDDTVRSRVLRWAFDRYDTSIPNTAGLDTPALATQASEVPPASVSKPTTTPTEEPSDSRFEHFAELFHAVAPKTEPEKALVAGYWFQIVLGKPSFGGAEANAELKHLGHALGNVTKSLTANQTRKPALVLQLKKSGSSKQARKTYKLTHEGVQWIVSRLG